VRFLDTLNRTTYKNVQRMNSDKNLTLALLNYADRTISISGQHEQTLVVRKGGQIEQIDTIDLGFPLGLEEDISEFISHVLVDLEPGGRGGAVHRRHHGSQKHQQTILRTRKTL
jgi:sigma-B regulation protein RsbU (phosphoserine phosphatase)